MHELDKDEIDGEFLTNMQLAFCKAYIVSKNGTEAARKAGYSDKNVGVAAGKLLSTEKIKKKIRELQDIATRKLDLDIDWCLMRFKDISDRCLTAEPVIINGVKTGEYKFDSAGAAKATENIAKHLGFYEKDNKQQAAKTISNINYTLKLKSLKDGEKKEE